MLYICIVAEMYRLLLSLWLLMLPAIGITLDLWEDPCKVTDIQGYVDNKTSSIVYETSVLNETLCASRPPVCIQGEEGGKVDARIARCGSSYKYIRSFQIQHKGQLVCFIDKECIYIKCGDRVSNEVTLPGINFSATYSVLFKNASVFKLRIQPPDQAVTFDLTVYEKYNTKNVIGKVTGANPAEDISIIGNYNTDACLKLRLQPMVQTNGNNCAGVASEGSLQCPFLTPPPLGKDQSEPKEIIFYVLGLLAILSCISAFIIFIIRKKQPYDTHRKVPDINEGRAQFVLVVHTKESKSLGQEVQGLVNTIQDTKMVKKVYDLFDIKDQEALSNAESWLLSHLSRKKQTSVILVCSSGLTRILRAIRNGEKDAETVKVLGRGFLPSDCLLLTFLRFFNDSSLAHDYERFFTVRFENAEDSVDTHEWQTAMEDVGLPALGRSRLFSLPSHLKDLTVALRLSDGIA